MIGRMVAGEHRPSVKCPECLGRGRLENQGDYLGTETCPTCAGAGRISAVRSTIMYLERCQAARAAGYPVAYTTDPAWLVTMAINRRAGWPDDPSLTRGSAMPIGGKYPAKASGDAYNHLRLISREVNTPRLIVRAVRLGEWRKLLLARLPHRFEP